MHSLCFKVLLLSPLTLPAMMDIILIESDSDDTVIVDADISQYPNVNDGDKESSSLSAHQLNSEGLCREVMAFFPWAVTALVVADLELTKSAELTLTRILDGEVWVGDPPSAQDPDVFLHPSDTDGATELVLSQSEQETGSQVMDHNICSVAIAPSSQFSSSDGDFECSQLSQVSRHSEGDGGASKEASHPAIPRKKERKRKANGLAGGSSSRKVQRASSSAVSVGEIDWQADVEAHEAATPAIRRMREKARKDMQQMAQLSAAEKKSLRRVSMQCNLRHPVMDEICGYLQVMLLSITGSPNLSCISPEEWTFTQGCMLCWSLPNDTETADVTAADRLGALLISIEEVQALLESCGWSSSRALKKLFEWFTQGIECMGTERVSIIFYGIFHGPKSGANAVSSRLQQLMQTVTVALQVQKGATVRHCRSLGDACFIWWKYVICLARGRSLSTFSASSSKYVTAVRNAVTPRELLTKFLLQVPGVSRAQAEAVSRVYSSVAHLYDSFANMHDSPHLAAGLLESIPVASTLGGNSRSLGPANSRRIWRVFTSSNSSEIV